jgi:hypothetical protein
MISFSQLQLENFYIKSLRMVEREPALNKKELKAGVYGVGVDYSYEDHENLHVCFTATLKVTVEPNRNTANPFMATEVILVGNFTILGQVETTLATLFKEQSAPSILYGVGRGIVAMLTGISTVGRADWPTLNLTSVCESDKKQAAETIAKRKASAGQIAEVTSPKRVRSTRTSKK